MMRWSLSPRIKGLLFVALSLISNPSSAQDSSLSSELTGKIASRIDIKTELYSETLYRKDLGNLSTQARLRSLIGIASPSGLSNQLNLMLGAFAEKEHSSNSSVPWIQDSLSPFIGLLFKPTTWLQFWTEYRSRNYWQSGERRNIGDPRHGLALNYYLEYGQNLVLEAYGESVIVSRWSNLPVSSAQVKTGPIWRDQLKNQWFETSISGGIYAELKGQNSPVSELGQTWVQGRLGLRASLGGPNLNFTLFGYKASEISTLGKFQSLDPEIQGVLGGSF